MTDTPDLRTLVAEVFPAGLVEALARVLADQFGGTWLGYKSISRRGLAAVLPAHRRQVLAEVAEVPVEHPASANVIQRATIEVGAEQLRKAIRRLASVAPETAPTPRHDDETAPAVGREAAQAQGPAEGDTALGADQIPERVYLDAAKAHVKALFSHRPQLSDATLTQSKRPGFRAAVAAAYRAGQAVVPDGPRTWQPPDDRERAKAAIHQPLHDLNVRIVDLAVGDCHCNLIAEVVLDALTDAERDNPKETP